MSGPFDLALPEEKLVKTLPDGRGVWLQPMTFGKVRVCVGPMDVGFYDDGW